MKNKVCLYINSKFGKDLFKKIGINRILNHNFNVYHASFEKIKNKKYLNFKSNNKNLSSYLLFFIQSFKLKDISSIYRYNVIRKDFKIMFFFLLTLFLKPIFFNPKFLSFLRNKIPINTSIDQILKKQQFKYVIIFCSIYGQDEYDLIKAARKNKIKSILVVDNWDNLATKITLVEKPDKLLVWGKEMIDCYEMCDYLHKKYVQKKIIGSPRFSFIKSKIPILNKNFHINKKNWEKKYNLNKIKKTILFIEHIRERDPLKILQILDHLVKINDLENEILIIYRPHPLRKNNIIDFKVLNGLKNVKVDKSIEKLLLKSQLRDLEDKDVPLINFLYSDSMIYCDGFISQISSALLDLTYLGKKGLLLSEGTPKKLFDRLLASQCFDYIHYKIFKKKVLNYKNAAESFKVYCKHLKKTKSIKSDSKKINYIIKDLDFDQFKKNLIKNIN